MMINSDIAFEIKEVKQRLFAVENELRRLSSKINPADEMWDVQDMWQHWKISKRLQADWRKENVIGYVQYKGKIWYPQEAREDFIAKYIVISPERKAVKTVKLDTIKLVKKFYKIFSPKEIAETCQVDEEQVYDWLNRRGYACIEIESKVFLTERQTEEFCNRD